MVLWTGLQSVIVAFPGHTYYSISPLVSEKLCLNIMIAVQYERHQVKGQMSTLTFGTHLLSLFCLIRSNMSKNYIDFGVNSIRKMIF